MFIHELPSFARYFCRSIEHDAMTRQCVLSEEDSVSQKDDVTVSASPTHHFYDLVCLDNRELTLSFWLYFLFACFDALLRFLILTQVVMI